MVRDDQVLRPEELGVFGDQPSAEHRLDAVIVPTVRRPAYLREAADLAINLDCPLVTLHSGKWSSAKYAAKWLPADVRLIAIDVRDPAIVGPPSLETSIMLAGTMFDRRADTSAKRNLGLVLASMLGWQHIVFLEDDILVDGLGPLQSAVSVLGNFNAARLPIRGFPNNSAVEHAHRAAGHTRQSITSGGALIVKLSEHSGSFFPDIYNDDWFYLLHAKTGLQPYTIAGESTQRIYDPFRNPARARAEELGAVLAEGMYWLLDQGHSIAEADHAFWRSALKRREGFLYYVLRQVEQADDIEPSDKSRMIVLLKAARGRLAFITPGLCVAYLRSWVRDWHQWQRYFHRMKIGLSLGSTLQMLAKDGAIQAPTVPTRRQSQARHALSS